MKLIHDPIYFSFFFKAIIPHYVDFPKSNELSKYHYESTHMNLIGKVCSSARDKHGNTGSLSLSLSQRAAPLRISGKLLARLLTDHPSKPNNRSRRRLLSHTRRALSQAALVLLSHPAPHPAAAPWAASFSPSHTHSQRIVS